MTSDRSIREPDEIRRDCAHKLRAVRVNDYFQAILGCLLREDWTTPRLVEMVITPDVHLLASAAHHQRDSMIIRATRGDSTSTLHSRNPNLPFA